MSSPLDDGGAQVGVEARALRYRTEQCAKCLRNRRQEQEVIATRRAPDQRSRATVRRNHICSDRGVVVVVGLRPIQRDKYIGAAAENEVEVEFMNLGGSLRVPYRSNASWINHGVK